MRTYTCPACGRKMWLLLAFSLCFWRYVITGRLCRCGHTPAELEI